MKNSRAIFSAFGIFIIVILNGCAWTKVEPIAYDDRKTDGVRVYDPKPILIVTETTTTVTMLPNYNRGYAVRYGQFLSKNKVNLQVKEGLITQIESDADTTGLLSLFQALGSEAIKGIDKLAALGAEIESGIPGMEGIYEFEFDTDGNFTGLKKIHVK